ncbi:MAG: acetate/propionate family kinase [Deltaproteobacteria bacterium]|nr:acetate/propionate family kinase [Deltaproteobacteria bacterium]
MASNELKHILTVNSGSSSIKFSLYHLGLYGYEGLKLSGRLERIGLEGGIFIARDAGGKTVKEERAPLHDHDAALKLLLGWLSTVPEGERIDAVGHRVVHGGVKYSRTQAIDAELLDTLGVLIPFAPEHLPHEIKAIEAVSKSFPEIAQAACFDTAFHRNMPEVAKVYGLPARIRDEGVVRYGFHGLSYEYILSELKGSVGEKAAGGRIVIAHLGNGASMAAVNNGRPVDTTMGFTPSGGLVMSTRPGDLDPGVVVYLVREKGMNAEELSELLDHRSGLLGISGISPDMRDLLSKIDDEPRAALAVELFCYQARKSLGALSAALGGLDTLVFTGGIGENSPEVRERICRDLEFLGIALDTKKNAANAPVISHYKSHVLVRVMKTNEEVMIARHTVRLLGEGVP